jgi:iron complex transport system ATP-binding protein
VTVAYTSAGREIIALREASISLMPHEVVGLVGPNGSGKTTLIRAITGTARLLTGIVRIGARELTSLSQPEVARQIAVVPQDPLLPPAFTALECVLMGRTPHLRLLQQESREDVETAGRAMVATDTWRFADRPVGELSGGERQRVVVARALAQETPILLLDEPTAHLDIGHQASILTLVRNISRNDGKGVLAVVHDLTMAAHYCDRLVMLNHGQVVAQGAPGDVLRADILERVYGASVAVFPNPASGRPVVAPGGDAG